MQLRFKGASVDATESEGEVAVTEASEGPEGWRSGRKADVVRRLLRGEELATVSREIGVPVHQLEDWRRVFVEGGKGHFRSRGEPDFQRELTRAGKSGRVDDGAGAGRGAPEKKGFGDDLKKLGR